MKHPKIKDIQSYAMRKLKYHFKEGPNSLPWKYNKQIIAESQNHHV